MSVEPLPSVEAFMRPSPPPSLFSTSPTIRTLRAQIEAATDSRFAHPFASGAVAVVWDGHGGAGAPRRLGRRVLRVSPGPLLSPYDTPATGLACLRLTLEGSPHGGVPADAALASRLRTLRLHGRNRFPGGLDGDAMPAGANLILLDGAATPTRNRAFVADVLARNPRTDFVAAGPEGGMGVAPTGRLRVLPGPIDPWAACAAAARVFVADAQSACTARLSGAEVVESGSLTGIEDAYGAGLHWFDPWTRAPIGRDDCLDRIAWLRARFRDNDRPTVLVGISRWKRPGLDAFTTGPYGPPVHAMGAEEAIRLAPPGARVLAWATRMPEHLEALCAEAGLPLSRVEDGFLRSVGLGASLRPGASIVVDDCGIYYDPRRDSRLARILKTAEFPPDLVARANALRRLVIARRLTKYNVGLSDEAGAWPTDRRIVLVPGQVEDDASVRHGSPVVRSNRALLAAARARNPDAFLLYKPHPDVEAGFRPGKIPEAEALTLADRIVGGLSIVDLLDRAHHVETMTSLAGFEALIRGLTVAVHGRPFYSGWGLTEDLAPNADRGRRLALDEIVAGTLLLYPLYLDPVAMKPCTAEQLLDRLAQERDAAAPSALALSRRTLLAMRARYAVLNPIVRALRARRGIARPPKGDVPE
ncbi:capsular polysaccharide export protein [Methylobacterium gossipiicola]|uniref:Capsular polysaccharide export protein n=2 Tax=Methylobacterium gossipiicola TaxID=582675 RepID=A0A1I2XMW4_9HYPH|nr:capsular polysaccharide export protein [Methylobacterium gossipiicola]